MEYKMEYFRWLRNVGDEQIKRQLEAIENNEKEIKECFGAQLAFGTAGLRGILGAGTARMNIYTVGRATQGLADYINECFGGGTVAVAYDSRNMSEAFSREVASVLAANNITTHLYSELMPTPMLSFAVRELGAKAGVMVTASHNPAEYNGYKVYGSDGCQMTTEDTDAVSARIHKVDVFDDVKRMPFELAVNQGQVKYIGKRVIEKYFAAVKAQQVNPKICRSYPLKIVYTPLNGAGNLPVRRIFEEIGVREVVVVPEQELPDGNFTTCPYPNPEMKDALKLGLALAEKEKPDLLLATDPDCDRIGVAVRDLGEYRILSGNEIGVLLLDYLIRARTENKTMPENPVAVKSVVSTSLADEIARAGGVELRTVLTGFKFIGEQILMLEQDGQENRFIFGFEESCGYLAGSYARDKDAVLAAMLVCEMASYHRSNNLTLMQALERIWLEHGFYRHKVLNVAFSGIEADAEMKALMDLFRAAAPQEIAGFAVARALDFAQQSGVDAETGETFETGLPAANILEYRLANGAAVMIRPSGTEPKMKIYLTAKEASAEQSDAVLELLAADMRKRTGQRDEK